MAKMKKYEKINLGVCALKLIEETLSVREHKEEEVANAHGKFRFGAGIRTYEFFHSGEFVARCSSYGGV